MTLQKNIYVFYKQYIFKILKTIIKSFFNKKTD